MYYKKSITLILTGIFIFTMSLLNAQNSNMVIHKKYAGKIVFAEKKINFENIDDGILKDKFRMLNSIYGKIFIEKPLADYYQDFNWTYDYTDEKFTYNFSTLVYVNGEERITWLDELTPEAFNKYTTFDIIIAPKPKDKFDFSLQSSDWADLISSLPEGEHKVSVEMKARNVEKPGLTKDPIASGSFTIKVEKSKIMEFVKKFDVQLPKATMIAPEVEEGVLVATKNLYDAMTPIQAIIIEPTGQWQFNRDMEGNILSRNFIAAVVLQSFEGDCYVKTARYFQDHRGNFQFDDVRMSEKLEDYLNYEIPCDNIK